ncbi:MAG: flagellar motor switch protein FliN [Candidatus Brocadiia bacterium]
MADENEQLAQEEPEEKAEVKEANFGELQDEGRGGGLSLDLVLDISMPVTVELGRATMTVRELLQMGPGSVVELDRSAGEPIDLYVRDVCFARGEVVVVDNNFGLRITEVINAGRRIRELGKDENGVDKSNDR